MDLQSQLTSAVLKERRQSFFSALHSLAGLGWTEQQQAEAEALVHQGLVQVILKDVLPACLKAPKPEYPLLKKPSQHDMVRENSLSALALALLALSRLGSPAPGGYGGGSVLQDLLLHSHPDLVQALAASLARAGDQGDGPAQAASLQLLVAWSHNKAILLQIGEERVFVLLLHILVTRRLPAYKGPASQSDDAVPSAQAGADKEPTGKKTRREAAPAGKAAQELDARLGVFSLMLLANLSVLLLYNEAMADNSAVRIAAQIFQNDTHPDMLLQSMKLLLNVANTGAELKAKVLECIDSFGYVLAVVMHNNVDVREAAKSLLGLFPVGQHVKAGVKATPADMSLKDQEVFQKRALQLRAAGNIRVLAVPAADQKRPAEPVAALRQCSFLTCHSTEPAPGKYLVCSRCKVAAYCSSDCQRRHWKDGHKKQCKKHVILVEKVTMQILKDLVGVHQAATKRVLQVDLRKAVTVD
eukprot:g33649.t1